MAFCVQEEPELQASIAAAGACSGACQVVCCGGAWGQGRRSQAGSYGSGNLPVVGALQADQQLDYRVEQRRLVY